VILIVLLTVAFVSLLACLALASQASRLKLQAIPGDHRHHQTPTPMVGGLAIFLALIAGCFLVDKPFHGLLPCLFLLCTVGAADDRYGLPFWVRFLMQIIAAYLMIELTGVQLNTLGYLVSDDELTLGKWSAPVTIFAVIGVINAINMSDGLDGLAGSLVLLVIISLLLLGSQNQTLLLISAAAIVGFLTLNLRIGRQYAKVFMGDAGSTMLGLLLAFALINASQDTKVIAPVTALWLLALPLIDAVGVLLVRPIKGRSPFSADRIHYHHQLIERGLSVNSTLMVALALQLLFIAIGFLLALTNIAQALQFYLFLSLFLIYFVLLLKNTNPKM